MMRHFRSPKLAGGGFSEFYWTCQWRIALRMREGQTYDTAISDLHNDRDFIKEKLDEISTRIRNSKSQALQHKGGNPDGRDGRGGGKGGGGGRNVGDGDKDDRSGGNRRGRPRTRRGKASEGQPRNPTQTQDSERLVHLQELQRRQMQTRG